jgi:ABC-type phosphate transport system substrate-binding protein
MTRRLLACLLLCAALAVPATLAVAADEVVAVVSARSPVAGLTAAQVGDIFLGKSARFPDGSPATPIDQPEESSVRERFYARYTGRTPSQVKAQWSKIIFTGRGQPPLQAANAAEVKKLIAANPQAIGYVDASQVDGNLRVVGGP